MSTLRPDLRQAQQYLAALSPKCEFTFQSFAEKGAKDPRLNAVLHGTLDQHADALISRNLAGAGIFVMVNEGDGVVHRGNKTCRTNGNVTRVRAAFCDLDGAPLEPLLHAALEPHIIVESSPGRWHTYWLTSDTALGDFKGIQLALAAKYNSDSSVCDLARVLRIPGFLHQKSEPFMTRLVRPVPCTTT